MPFHLPSIKCLVASIFAFVQFRTESGQRLGPNSHPSLHRTTKGVWQVGTAHRWLTNRVTLPPPPALAEAGAVQHVPLVMALVEGLVHVVGDAIHDALVWGREQSTSAIALSSKTEHFCLEHHSLCLISTQTDHDQFHPTQKGALL